MKKYLIALPGYKGTKGFCHPTILIRAKDKNDAIQIVSHLKPKSYIGDIKEVDY